ncbi:WYL domain-containing protein [Pollutibacter soli]|uniref:helix-turn-helix transcriptional regulator n=1 Tax=Pollutibacter soli TaxID=3034157 RepID=UPI003013202B
MPALKNTSSGRVAHAEDRVKMIDELLRKYSHVGNRKQLLQRLNAKLSSKISERTLDGDLSYLREKLKESGTGIRLLNSASKGFYYSEPGFSLYSSDLNTDDNQMLDLAKNMFTFFKGTSLQQRFEQLVGKISKGSNFTDRETAKTPPGFQLDLPDTEKATQWIDTLLEAIFEQQALEMEYDTFEKGISTKLISPYLIRQYRNRWFLVAHDQYCDREEKVNVFALESIRQLLPSNKRFFSDPDFNASDYFRYSLGIWHWHNRPPIKVKLQFNDYITMIQNNPLHHSQKTTYNKKKNILTVQIEVYDTPELVQLILAYGEHVKVIQPSTLADRIANSLKKAASSYSARRRKR